MQQQAAGRPVQQQTTAGGPVPQQQRTAQRRTVQAASLREAWRGWHKCVQNEFGGRMEAVDLAHTPPTPGCGYVWLGADTDSDSDWGCDCDRDEGCT